MDHFPSLLNSGSFPAAPPPEFVALKPATNANTQWERQLSALPFNSKQGKEIRIPLTPLRPMGYHIERKVVKSSAGHYKVCETREFQLQNPETTEQTTESEDGNFKDVSKDITLTTPEFTVGQTINANLATNKINSSFYLNMDGRDVSCPQNQMELDLGLGSFFDAPTDFMFNGQQGGRHGPHFMPGGVPHVTAIPSNNFFSPPSQRRLLRSSSDFERSVAASSPDGSDAQTLRHRDMLAVCEKKEKELIEELDRIQAKVAYLKKAIRRQNTHISPEQLANRKSKKLKPNTYEALFSKVCENGEFKEMYVKADHPKPSSISELAGMMYFLLVEKTAKRPPQVGFSFRSYSDSHYTSVNRDDPMICKVKQWQAEDPIKQWRLYHFYRGNKRYEKGKTIQWKLFCLLLF